MIQAANELDINTFMGRVSKSAGMEEDALIEFVSKLQKAFILNAEDLIQLSDDDYNKLGIPLGLKNKIQNQIAVDFTELAKLTGT